MLKKVIFSTIFIAIIVAFISIFTQQTAKEDTPSTKTDTPSLTVEDTRLLWSLAEDIRYEAYGYTFSNSAQQMVNKLYATDFIHTVDVQKDDQVIGQLAVTIRQIDNEDMLVFSQFINTSDTAYTIPLKLTFLGETGYELAPFQQEIPQEHDNVFGIDHTTNMKGIFSFDNSSRDLALSQNYISRELTESYPSGAESVLRELISEDLSLEESTADDALTFQLRLRTTGGEQISENWFMIGQDDLFSSTDEMVFYKNYTNHHFIRAQKWLVHGGNYTKLPWSVEPGTKLGYGRNLVHLRDKNLVDHYSETKDRYYYNLIVDNVNNLLDFKDDNNLWLTEYTSAWLNREYGIAAPYTDTRHNENIAIYLTQVGELFDNPDLQNSYLNYADFLVEQQAIDNILRTENGYYVLDYYSPNQTKKTHVSLNHALGEMNFLFNAYEQSNKEQYLETALQIKAAVEDTGADWIKKENGDLWYQINSDASFESTDYETLTLEDLLASLANYEKFELPIPAVYDTLIESKIAFIMNTNIPISDALYNNLRGTKYADLIEDYEHVYSLENN